MADEQEGEQTKPAGDNQEAESGAAASGDGDPAPASDDKTE